MVALEQRYCNRKPRCVMARPGESLKNNNAEIWRETHLSRTSEGPKRDRQSESLPLHRRRQCELWVRLHTQCTSATLNDDNIVGHGAATVEVRPVERGAAAHLGTPLHLYLSLDTDVPDPAFAPRRRTKNLPRSRKTASPGSKTSTTPLATTTWVRF